MMGLSSMRCSLLAVAMMLAYAVAAEAQGPTFKLGRTPTEQELRPADAAIGPDGKGLPPGRGTAKDGALTYSARGCAKCHGSTGTEGPGPRLVRGEGGGRPGPGLGAPPSGEGIASHPFATMIWSYINQMMPLDLQRQVVNFGYIPGRLPPRGPTGSCCLTPDEVYGLTGYLLYRNGIIREDEVMDADSLPKVQMPNRDSYIPPPFIDTVWKPGMRQAHIR